MERWLLAVEQTVLPAAAQMAVRSEFFLVFWYGKGSRYLKCGTVNQLLVKNVKCVLTTPSGLLKYRIRLVKSRCYFRLFWWWLSVNKMMIFNTSHYLWTTWQRLMRETSSSLEETSYLLGAFAVTDGKSKRKWLMIYCNLKWKFLSLEGVLQLSGKIWRGH